MLMLFICITIGFILRKTHILPENAGSVMAKLVTWVFAPALSFITLAKNCTVETLSTHAANVLLSICALALAMAIGIALSFWFVREKSPDRGAYQYGLVFANNGYIGDPVIQSLFGDVMLSYYKLFTLPMSLVIYTWGISVLVPDGADKKSVLKKLCNAPTIATLAGVVAGLTGLCAILPDFLTNTLNTLKGCMGPTAMLVAGFTVAGYSITEMLKDKKVYLATALRLLILPALIVGFTFGLKELANHLFSLNIGNTVLFLAFVAYAAPLGLNSVVFPEAYGGNPKPGAGMALISHTLFVVTMPLLFAVMYALFGAPVL
jgi:predicted permease